MSFTLLLVILSLVIIVPVFFIIKSNKNNRLNDSQAYKTPSASSDINQQSTAIDLKALPNLYQQIILDIEAQFFDIKQKQQTNTLPSESFLTANRLFYTRLPKIINDYLKLEPEYAKTQIIDDLHQLTSFEVVHRQLKAILNLFCQINQSSNQLYLQNILSNQRYLQSIQQAEGIIGDLPTLSGHNLADSRLDLLNNNASGLQNSDYQAGIGYIQHYLSPTASQAFSQHFISQVGQLVYFASITQLAIASELGEGLAKLRIQADLELEALSNLLAYQLPQKLQAIQKGDVTAQEQQLQPIFSQLLQQLNDMLATLDKPLPIADKLALVQNLHDDVAELVESHF